MKNTTNNIKIGVVGAGSWGTALANHLSLKGFKIDLWAYEKEVKDQIITHRENKTFLPGFLLSDNLAPTNDIVRAAENKDLVLIVVPSHLVRETTLKIADSVQKHAIVVSASKGIENKTHLTMSGVLKQTLPSISENLFAVLSGPSFAKEVAQKAPTVITAAATDYETACFVQRVFATPYLRVYTNNDPLGVELGGAIKNVIAIAAGISDGLGFGLNTRAALITRGLLEIRRLGVRQGADPRTFTGLSGVGDLILTCTGSLSRNHTLGKKIGEGMVLSRIISEMNMVAEGVKTTKSVYNLARRLGVEVPIINEIYHVLYDETSPKEAVNRLMTRTLKQELGEYE
jgi:glycerol-3-phosphate dehydrogenase (NAD(P)+)